MTHNFIVTAYFTLGTLYESRAKILEASLQRHNVPYHIQGVKNLGTWLKNTGFKPTFVKQMLHDFSPYHVVYVDVDAEFQTYPFLFDGLADDMQFDVAAHEFDRSCYRKSDGGTELLSGTLFFKNTERAMKIVSAWEDRCKDQPNVWDQKSLEHVVGEDYDRLPGEYCKIFDRQDEVKHPVIVHFQASRQVRKNRGILT